jgi:hypothetical protein
VAKTLQKEDAPMSKRPSLSRSARLLLETLESRSTPAGNVAATFSAGTLTLTGDALGNDITITTVMDPDVPLLHTIVTGNNETLVNGLPWQAFSGVSHIVIRLNQGNDKLYFGVQGATGGNSFTIPGNLTIDLGPGDDDLTFSDSTVGGNTVIRGRQGSDSVVFGDSSSVFFGGNVTVLLEQGNDSFGMSFVGGHTFGKNLVIDGGQDGDFLSVDGATVLGTLTMRGGAGGDSLLVDSSTVKKLLIDAGAGDDFVGILDTTVQTYANIQLGAGDDGISVFNTPIGIHSSSVFDGGPGTDTDFSLIPLKPIFPGPQFPGATVISIELP